MDLSKLDQKEHANSENDIQSRYEHRRKHIFGSESHKLKKTRIWQITSTILGVLLIISIFAGNFPKTKSSNLTGNEIADKTVKFINQNLLQGQATATLKNVKESGNLYNLQLSIDGKDMDSYVTKDGKLLFPQAVDLTKKPQLQQSPENFQKSDKPKIELFVMSHCPYGTQIEKGIIPVVNGLKDKIDFEIKFVNYAMHGKKELDEQLRQYCVQRDYNDKYLSYLSTFLKSGDSNEALSAISHSEADLAGCVKETDEKYKVTELYNNPQKNEWSGSFPPFKVHDAENKRYGIGGSPTLIINGKNINSGRDAQSLLNIICGAFANKPKGCSADMTSFGTPSPGFGFGTQGGSATSAGCGA